MTCSFLKFIAGIVLTCCTSLCQQATTDQAQPSAHESKRLFGIIPNYRTFSMMDKYKPLTVREKFKEAQQDTLDRGTFELAAAIAAQSQYTNANRSFGQGVAGSARYFGAAYGDLAIGDYMTEAVFPTILHEDPRYFRRATGSTLGRLGYAIGTIFWTHRDSGGMQFNFSEFVGNSVAVAISDSYYADNRDVGDNVSKLGLQVGFDMAGNILKEFYPDIKRKLSRNSH